MWAGWVGSDLSPPSYPLLLHTPRACVYAFIPLDHLLLHTRRAPCVFTIPLHHRLLTVVVLACVHAQVACWVAQFLGHGVFEKRAPAVLDNLVQAIFMAPLFVIMEVRPMS